MSLFRKKASSRSNIRRKQRGSDDEEADHDVAAAQLPSNNAIKGPSLLSFEEENDGPEFQVKRSSQSRKMEKLKKKLRKEKLEEKEDEEEENTLVFSSSNTVKEEKEVSLPVFRPKTIVIPDSEDSTPSFSKSLKDGSIPDARTVYLARKQRQRARDGEVIPLDDTQVYRKEGSRLIREEDENDASDMEEEGGRFYSKKQLVAEEEEQRKQTHAEFLDIEQGESDEERDEEFERWEREQIKKAVSAQQLTSLTQDQGLFSEQHGNGRPHANGAHLISIIEPEPMDLDMDVNENAGGDFDRQRKKKNFVPKLPPAPQPLSLQDLLAKFDASVEEKENFHRERFREQEKVGDHLHDNEARVARLTELEPKLKEQYKLFQEMRTYSLDLLDCFNEKIEAITELEDSIHSLLQSRADFLIRRRRMDVRDQFEECSRPDFIGGPSQTGNVEPERMMRVADRDARRIRRRQAREKLVLSGAAHEEGMSSDDEEAPSRTATMEAEIRRIEEEGKTVLTDVREDFCSISEICHRFCEWNRLDPSSFEEAYIALCIPKLISPLLRLQLLNWDPIERAEDQKLAEQAWYKELLKLGSMGEGEPPVFLANLIPDTVEKVIIPKLTALIRSWDPTSSRRSKNLAELLKSLTATFPTINIDSKHVESLLGQVHSRCKDTLDDDLFTPIYSKELLENPNSGSRGFLDRQFWFSLKVFKNLLGLEGFLSRKIVQELVLDGILNRHLVLAMQCSVLTESSVLVKCRSVIDVLPPAWVKVEGKTELEPFSKLLWRMGEEMFDSVSDSRKSALKEVHSFLLKVGSKTKADKFSASFSVR